MDQDLEKLVVTWVRQSGKIEMRTEWLRSYRLRRQIEKAVRETLGSPPKADQQPLQVKHD
jgi:hypothetical protein